MKRFLSLTLALLLLFTICITGCDKGDKNKGKTFEVTKDTLWEDIESDKVTEKQWCNAFKSLGLGQYTYADKELKAKSVSVRVYADFDDDSDMCDYDFVCDIKAEPTRFYEGSTGQVLQFKCEMNLLFLKTQESGSVQDIFGGLATIPCGSTYVLGAFLYGLGDYASEFITKDYYMYHDKHTGEETKLVEYSKSEKAYVNTEKAYYYGSNYENIKYKFKNGLIVASQKYDEDLKGTYTAIYYDYDKTTVNLD